MSAHALAGLAAPSLRVLQISYCGAGTDAALETAARMWRHSLEGEHSTPVPREREYRTGGRDHTPCQAALPRWGATSRYNAAHPLTIALTLPSTLPTC